METLPRTEVFIVKNVDPLVGSGSAYCYLMVRCCACSVGNEGMVLLNDVVMIVFAFYVFDIFSD